MESTTGRSRLGALCAQTTAFFLHPVRGPLIAILATIPVLVALECLPGMPTSLRPYTRYKYARAATFLIQATEAHARHDLRNAYLALESSLALNPASRPARIELARLLVDAKRYDEAAEQARILGLGSTTFTHDLLFYEGRYDELLGYCVHQAIGSAQRGIWLQSLLMIVHHSSDLVVTDWETRLAGDTRPETRMVRSILSLKNRPALAVAECKDIPVARPPEVLLGLEVLMQAGDTREAWIWLQRHRQSLSAFDAACGDYRVAVVNDPISARRILTSFASMEMNEARWLRLIGLVAITGDNEAGETYCRLLSENIPHPSAQLAVAAWTLMLLNGDEAKASEWEQAFRQSGGNQLPIIIGRKLADPDPAVRNQAVRLLSSSVPLAREMIAALLMR